MKIERFVLGSLATNCYLVENEETKELVVIDPATCPDEIIGHVRRQGYEPKAILLTHGHFDHVMGIDRWAHEFGIPVYLYEDEKEVLSNPEWNLSAMFGKPYSYSDGIGVNDGEVLFLAGLSFRVLHTPGHTKGGCCYYVEKEDALFSGDTLFFQSIGRTDFPTGNMSVLARSIRERLFALPDETKVYPGHGDYTSIGDEILGT